MKYLDLRQKIPTNVFTVVDVLKFFPQDSSNTIKTQLFRLIKKGVIQQIKRGIYTFDLSLVDELELSNLLYSPSYISLETALHFYGIIPDIPQAVTSVTSTTTKQIQTKCGAFFYQKIKQSLFFGYKVITGMQGYFKIAKKEKALLDYFYIRKINRISGLRFALKAINIDQYTKYSKKFPEWVQRLRLK